jgi:hypothetical protein
VFEQGGLSFLQRDQVLRLVVRKAIDPAAIQNADPLERQDPQRRLVRTAARPVSFVEGLGPEGSGNGLGHPLDEGLAEEGRAGVAPMDPAFVATALGDRSDTGVLLEGGGVRESLAVLTKRHEQAWREGGSSPGKAAKSL